jgi:hypothetical protein
MRQSVTRSAIAQVSRYVHSQRLKAVGFARNGVHMYRSSDDLFHGIHFQGSQWGSADEGRFTINLVVASPAAYEGWTGKAFPSNPATALFPIQQRIGLLMPKHTDHWWDVSSTTDIVALCKEVLFALSEHATSFFEAYPNTASILARLREGELLPGLSEAQAVLVHAIVAKASGFPEEAATQIRTALAQVGKYSSSGKVELVARRLGLPCPV